MKKKTIGKEYIFTALILFVVLAVTMVLDSQLPSYHIVIKVIKKASVYSLVAVSMNLLNGFTGLFSLGQAGFMLLGAYSYAVLCIPVAKRAGVYQYFDGGWVQFSYIFCQHNPYKLAKIRQDRYDRAIEWLKGH